MGEVELDDGEARMTAHKLHGKDFVNIPNGLFRFQSPVSSPARHSFDIRWSGPVTNRSKVSDPTIGFAGTFILNQATLTWSASNGGERLGGCVPPRTVGIGPQQVTVETVADLGDGQPVDERADPAALVDHVLDQGPHVPLRARRGRLPLIGPNGGERRPNPSAAVRKKARVSMRSYSQRRVMDVSTAFASHPTLTTVAR